MTSRSRAALVVASCLATGVLVALALPPWGWWPLAIVGIAAIDRLTVGRGRGVRFRRGALFGLGWLAPGMAWMVFLTLPGYAVASLIYAVYIGTAFALAPTSRWRLATLPAAIMVLETVRWAFPFQGVPLASLAIGQASGPFAPIARLGGALLLSGAMVALGVAVSEIVAPDGARRRAALGVGAVVALAAAGAIAPRGQAVGTLRVAVIQGGGPQGTRAVNTDERVVFERHLDATRALDERVDLILWPENVVNVDGAFADSRERAELGELARSLATPLAVGIVEDVAPGRFVNAQVLIDERGNQISRYDKVRRVPFGEYMPLRRLLEALGAPTELVPKDAVSGTDPAVLDSQYGRLGVVISWEVFFAGRAREAVRNGGQVVLNPTNGSSYRGTILQTQQVASSRLRALETGRWVVQAAPTGLSAFVTPTGRVIDRTAVSERAVITHDVELRTGCTIAVQIGDKPYISAAAAVLVAAMIAARRRRSQLDDERDGTVVDQLDRHLGAEAPGGHTSAERR